MSRGGGTSSTPPPHLHRMTGGRGQPRPSCGGHRTQQHATCSSSRHTRMRTSTRTSPTPPATQRTAQSADHHGGNMPRQETRGKGRSHPGREQAQRLTNRPEPHTRGGGESTSLHLSPQTTSLAVFIPIGTPRARTRGIDLTCLSYTWRIIPWRTLFAVRERGLPAFATTPSDGGSALTPPPPRQPRGHLDELEWRDACSCPVMSVRCLLQPSERNRFSPRAICGVALSTLEAPPGSPLFTAPFPVRHSRGDSIESERVDPPPHPDD